MENYEFNQSQQNNNFVMQQNLPNATAVLVLGILSIIGCCCYGVVGVILAIIALVLANKDLKLYNANPSQYKSISALNTGKILSIIGLVLSIIYLLLIAYVVFIYGYQNYQDDLIEWTQSMQEGL